MTVGRGMLRGVLGALRLGPDVHAVGGVVVPKAAAMSLALREVDLSQPAGAILHGHSFGSLSFGAVAGNGTRPVTWTGSGGNANDTLYEQMHVTYPIEDPSGNVVTLADRTHVARYRFDTDPATWSGANAEIVGAGITVGDGASIASPGNWRANANEIRGIMGAGRAANISYGGQSATGSGVVAVEGWWIPDPDPSSPVFGAMHAVCLDAAGAVVASTTKWIATAIAGDVVALALCLGNDSSLTSGATYTEPMRLRALAIPLT